MGRVCVEEVNMSLQRLLNTRMLELRRQLLASGSNTTTTTTTSSRDPPPVHLSRNLFGPSDRDHNLQFAQQEMEKVQQADCRRWNFDFRTDKPREGRYQWQEGDENVPRAYEIPSLTCRASKPASTSTHAASRTPRRNNKCVKRLHKKPPAKSTQKLCTDYFRQVKVSKNQSVTSPEKDAEPATSAPAVNIKLSDILKIRSLNVR